MTNQHDNLILVFTAQNFHIQQDNQEPFIRAALPFLAVLRKLLCPDRHLN